MSKNKNKRKKKHGGSGPPPAADPTAFIEELVALRPSLEGADSGPNWGAAHKLFLKAGLAAAEIPPIVIGRDLEAFDRAVRALQGLETEEEVASEGDPSAEDAPPEVIPTETLRKAMKAFRRRIKLIKLDQESKLGVGPMSSGRSADFESILPPHEFPRAVWQALAADGRLEATGRGFYKLPDP